MSLAASDYPNFLAKLKDDIRQARLQAMLSVNRELVLLYWPSHHRGPAATGLGSISD
jgi:hypothetical protein